MITELQELVIELNAIAYESQSNNSVTFEPFVLSSTGQDEAITFLDSYNLWSSNDSPTDSVKEVRRIVIEELEKIAAPLTQLLKADYTKKA